MAKFCTPPTLEENRPTTLIIRMMTLSVSIDPSFSDEKWDSKF